MCNFMFELLRNILRLMLFLGGPWLLVGAWGINRYYFCREKQSCPFRNAVLMNLLKFRTWQSHTPQREGVNWSLVCCCSLVLPCLHVSTAASDTLELWCAAWCCQWCLLAPSGATAASAQQQRPVWEHGPEDRAPTHSNPADKVLMSVARYGHSMFWLCCAGAKSVCNLFICTMLKIIIYYLMSVPYLGYVLAISLSGTGNCSANVPLTPSLSLGYFAGIFSRMLSCNTFPTSVARSCTGSSLTAHSLYGICFA